jgi:hypothetical protein
MQVWQRREVLCRRRRRFEREREGDKPTVVSGGSEMRESGVTSGKSECGVTVRE